MISIIVPTYLEAGNIGELIKRTFSVLRSAGIEAEIIVVDDSSPDGTAGEAQDLARDFNVRVLIREKRGSLSSAVLFGISRASSDIVCVMDADLSHPPEAIPAMYELIKNGSSDFVIGSRLVPGGGSTDWSFGRRAVSAVSRLFARPITGVKDPTSGFFMMRRSVIEGAKLNALGFKICLEIIAKGRYNKLVEVPITFLGRKKKKSKLGLRQITEYFLQVFSLYVYGLKCAIKGKG